jgi:putative transposase
VQRLSLENPRYGYRRITALVRREGWSVSHKRVARIRGEDNRLALRGAAFRPATTDSRHAHVRRPNLARGLVLTSLNQMWAADITYVRLEETFVYLAVVLDVFSRKVVGWALADHMRAGRHRSGAHPPYRPGGFSTPAQATSIACSLQASSPR